VNGVKIQVRMKKLRLVKVSGKLGQKNQKVKIKDDISRKRFVSGMCHMPVMMSARRVTWLVFIGSFGPI